MGKISLAVSSPCKTKFRNSQQRFFFFFQGVVDAVAVQRSSSSSSSSSFGELTLLDWKTSGRRRPTLASTYDAPLQAAAYVGAANADPRHKFR